MSLTSALSIALSGLQAQSTALSVVSSNIANAQTPGYTEKSLDYSSLSLGADLGGVSISGYTRATDAALTASLNTATSSAGYLSTQYSYLQQVQSILDSTATNPTLSSDLSTFQSDLTNLASSPESSIQQQTVVNDGNKLAQDIQSIDSQVTALQKQATTDITSNVSTLNADLAKVQSLNTQIATANASGQPIVDLEDERDTTVTNISSITSVTVMQRSNGQIALYTPGGTTLVDGQAQTFTYDGTNVTNSAGQTETSGFTGGSLQAQLGFVDTSSAAASSANPGIGVIAKLQSQLSTLVGALTNSNSAFVSAYSSAVTASTAAGASQNGDSIASSFFTVGLDNNGNPDPGTFAVNASLLNTSATLPETGVDAISNSFTSTANYTASGLSAKGVTYTQLGTAILSNFQLAANTLKSSSSDASSQQTYYSTTQASTTGVDTDTELVNLTTLQNSYAAAAHMISTIETLFTTLEDITTTS